MLAIVPALASLARLRPLFHLERPSHRVMERVRVLLSSMPAHACAAWPCAACIAPCAAVCCIGSSARRGTGVEAPAHTLYARAAQRVPLQCAACCPVAAYSGSSRGGLPRAVCTRTHSAPSPRQPMCATCMPFTQHGGHRTGREAGVSEERHAHPARLPVLLAGAGQQRHGSACVAVSARAPLVQPTMACHSCNTPRCKDIIVAGSCLLA